MSVFFINCIEYKPALTQTEDTQDSMVQMVQSSSTHCQAESVRIENFAMEQ